MVLQGSLAAAVRVLDQQDGLGVQKLLGHDQAPEDIRGDATTCIKAQDSVKRQEEQRAHLQEKSL